jgi:hypothetical protein
MQEWLTVIRKCFVFALLAAVVLFPSFVRAQYATSPQRAPDQNVAIRPRLRFEPAAAKITDEVARAGNQYLIFRSGENVPLLLTRGAVLRLGLDSHLNTGKFKEGVPFTRILEVRAPLQSRFNAMYAEKGTSVETLFSGRSSGFKNRAILVIIPMQFQIEVGPTDYKVIDSVNGSYVALKPGKWRLELQCSLTHIVSPDGEMWTASTQSETEGILGNHWGREGREQFYPDPFSPLAGVPGINMIYPIIELKGLFKMLIHRPNIIVPSESDIYFQVNRMTGTYLGPSVPTDPATIVR